jgi:hypothetical protein
MRLGNMTTRKLFAGIALTSLAGIAIFGGVLAWKTSDSARGAALVGSNGFKIHYRPECTSDAVAPADPEDPAFVHPCLTLIGYNGVITTVGAGKGENNGDFKLAVVGGSLEVRAVLSPVDPAVVAADTADRRCGPEDFAGRVVLSNPGEIIPPGETGGEFKAALAVKPSAPANCQGKVVIYKVTIEAENPQPSPAEVS